MKKLITLVWLLALSACAEAVTSSEGNEEDKVIQDCNQRIREIVRGAKPDRTQELVGMVAMNFSEVGTVFIMEPDKWKMKPGIIVENCQIRGFKLIIHVKFKPI